MQALPRGVDRLDRGVPSHRRSPVVVEGVDRRDRRATAARSGVRAAARIRTWRRPPRWPPRSRSSDDVTDGRPAAGRADAISTASSGRKAPGAPMRSASTTKAATATNTDIVSTSAMGHPRGPIGGRRFVDRAADDRAERGRDHHHSGRGRDRSPPHPIRTALPVHDREGAESGRRGRRTVTECDAEQAGQGDGDRRPRSSRPAPTVPRHAHQRGPGPRRVGIGEGLRSTRILTLRNGRGRDRIRRTGNVATVHPVSWPSRFLPSAEGIGVKWIRTGARDFDSS